MEFCYKYLKNTIFLSFKGYIHADFDFATIMKFHFFPLAKSDLSKLQ